MITSMDVVSSHAGMHLTDKGGKLSYCGKNDHWLYRVEWSGGSEQICKNCIKNLTKKALEQQKKELQKRDPLKVTYDRKEWIVVRRRYLQTKLLSKPSRVEVIDLKRISYSGPRRSIDILLLPPAVRKIIRNRFSIDERAST